MLLTGSTRGLGEELVGLGVSLRINSRAPVCRWNAFLLKTVFPEMVCY